MRHYTGSKHLLFYVSGGLPAFPTWAGSKLGLRPTLLVLPNDVCDLLVLLVISWKISFEG